MSRTYTTCSLATCLGVDPDTAYALITFLRRTGCVRVCGTEKHPANKGRGASLYEVDAEKLAEWLPKIGGI